MSQRESLNVSLPGELKRYVANLVRSGNYGSASEVVRAALRLLQANERQRLIRNKEEH